MKRLLILTTVVVTTFTVPAIAADVGVSISIGQPGFYGQLDIGDFPQPQVINSQPIVIERGAMNRPPIYLRVPPMYIKHWKKHCREYNACGERVFFVQDNWYNREYVPRYQEQHRDRHDEHRIERKDDHREKQREDHREDTHEHGREH
jgi:hypothetical protein